MFRINIDGSEFRYFQSYDLSLKFNSIADTFSFTGLKRVLPGYLGYNDCEIFNEYQTKDSVTGKTINKTESIIKGTILNQSNKISTKAELSTVSGYSKCGIIEDVTIPVSSYPLQNDNLTLKEICDKLLKPFGIEYIVDSIISSEFNKKFRKSSADPSQSIKDYINSLASQRGIVLTHNRDGKLLFTKVNISKLKPVVRFVQGGFGVMEMSIDLNGQSLHSEITVIKQASSDNPDAGEKTIKNPYCKKFRPTTKVLNSGDIFDMYNAARMALSDELATIKLSIFTTKLVYPGNLVTVNAPGLGINDDVDFFVEETSVKGSTSGELFTLTCVLKDIYTLNAVQNIFDRFEGPKFI